MKSINEFLITEPRKNQEADTNEMIGMLLAGSILAYACAPLLGNLTKGLGDLFSNWFGGNKDKDKDDDKGKDKEKETDNETGKEKNSNSSSNSSDDGDSKSEKKDHTAFLLGMAKKANEKEKDENAKKKNDAMIGLLCACSYDKDGKEIPMEERLEKMKGMMSDEQFESFKKEMTETYEKNKDNQEFKDAMAKAAANIKPEEYDKMIEDAKTQAKTTLETVEKEKAEIDEYEKKLKEIEDELNGATGEEKDKLMQQQQQLQQNPPQSTLAAATGVTASGAPATPEGGAEPKPEDKPAEKPEGEAEPKPEDKPAEKPEGETEQKPKERTAEEIKAEHDKIEKDYKEKSKKLEDEYQAKMDAETDEDKKKKLEDEWEKKEKELSAAKNKAMDDIDDTDEHDTEKDETKKGKYKVKEEEITDPKTGEKKKVKTYTGPRGGKFYYPEGSPHKPENKVYVECLSLSDYLLESLE